MQLILDKIQKFKEYTNTFFTENDFDNENISFKVEHSLRVLSIAQDFFFRNNNLMSDDDVISVLLASLFHDFGRFEQYKKYKTYADNLSVDHGVLGVNVLNETKIIEDCRDVEFILKAIEQHNKKEICMTLDEKAYNICTYVRDFDKIEIMTSITRAFETNMISEILSLHLINDSDKVSEDLLLTLASYNKNDFQYIDYSKMLYRNDMMISMLSWLYQFNYKESLQLIFDLHIPQRIITLLPDYCKTSVKNFVERILRDFSCMI